MSTSLPSTKRSTVAAPGWRARGGARLARQVRHLRHLGGLARQADGERQFAHPGQGDQACDDGRHRADVGQVDGFLPLQHAAGLGQQHPGHHLVDAALGRKKQPTRTGIHTDGLAVLVFQRDQGYRCPGYQRSCQHREVQAQGHHGQPGAQNRPQQPTLPNRGGSGCLQGRFRRRGP